MSRRRDSAADHNFDENQISLFREIFPEFDKDGDGTLDTKYIGIIMRSLGQSPTESEIQDICISVDEDGSGSMDFSEFLTVMANYVTEETDTKEDICSAFKIFDEKGKGTIPASDLRTVLTTIGDALTADEIDEMIKVADTDGTGMINYIDFVTKMMSEKSEKRVEIVENSNGEK